MAKTLAIGVKVFTTAAPGTSTAVSILASNQQRQVAYIQNAGSTNAYLGGAATLTTANGIVLSSGATFTDERSVDAWFGLSLSGTADLRICEVQ